MTAFDGNLTRRRAILASAVVLLTLGPAAALADARWQDLGAIKAAASEWLERRIGSDRQDTSVEAGFLDPRLRLPACEAELEPFLNRGVEVDRATTVGVRCTGRRPWKVYVPVAVVTKADVVVAARFLAKGALIGPDDLRLERRDVTRNRSGYFTSVDAAAGQRVRQPVLEGRLLTPVAVAADKIIRRGQSVTLIVNSNGLRINMSGKALIDGAIGQRIRVQNSSSGRVVEGIVRSPEHVEILVQSSRGVFRREG